MFLNKRDTCIEVESRPAGRLRPGHWLGPAGRSRPGHWLGAVGRQRPGHWLGAVGRLRPACSWAAACMQLGRGLQKSALGTNPKFGKSNHPLQTKRDEDRCALRGDFASGRTSALGTCNVSAMTALSEFRVATEPISSTLRKPCRSNPPTGLFIKRYVSAD